MGGPLAPGIEYAIERSLRVAEAYEHMSGLEMRQGRWNAANALTERAAGIRECCHLLGALQRAEAQLYAGQEEPTVRLATTVEMDAEPGQD